MVRRWSLLVVLIAWMASPGAGYCDLITFQNKSIDLLVNTGPQSEGAFTYQAMIGQGWEVITALGNPPSSLVTFFNGQGSAVGDTVEITRTGGGLFTFASVDFRTILAANSDDVQITGLLGAATVGTLNLTGSSLAFQTVASGFAALPIDTLRIRITGGAGNNALLLDNFNLNAAQAIPEPASVALFGLAGLSLLGYRAVRRKLAPV